MIKKRKECMRLLKQLSKSNLYLNIKIEESKIFSIFLLRKKSQICKKIKKYLYLSILYVLQNIMTIDTVSEHEYKQNNVKENFAEREVSDLINKTRNALNKLESSVVMIN
jgi:hypothetical protein